MGIIWKLYEVSKAQQQQESDEFYGQTKMPHGTQRKGVVLCGMAGARPRPRSLSVRKLRFSMVATYRSIRIRFQLPGA